MLNPKLNPDLLSRILEAPFIIKDYVEGEDRCNYEVYLTELLNSSEWIRKQFPDEFIHRDSQSHGECDAYSGDYGIDFKLISSKTSLQARNILSIKITKYQTGTTLYRAPDSNRTVQITRMSAALREKSLDELQRIRHSQSRKYGVDNDIKTLLKTLETQKNLLLFYPYTFKFNKDNYQNGTKIIVDTLQYSFGTALCYRSTSAPGYRTFFLTIYQTTFILMDVVDNKLILVDTIPTSKCETFEYLKRYSGFWR